MALLESIKNNWAAWAVIGVIIGGSIGGWNYAMAQVKETARTEVAATVNKETLEGAKQAAKEAVKEIVPDIAKQVAQETVKEMMAQQKKAEEEAKKGKTP